MVSRRHDDVHRHDRVGDRQSPGPVAAHTRVQGAGGPEGPRAVQARHRGERVGDRPHAFGVEVPERRILEQRVDEPERAPITQGVEQPRRHQREQGEPEQPERREERQRVAPQGVGVGAAAVEPHDHRERHDQVRRPVEVVGGDDQRSEVQRPLLDGQLVVDPEHLLDVDDQQGVVEGLAGARDGAAAHQLVDGVHGEHGDDLLPPVQDRPVAQRPATSPARDQGRDRSRWRRLDLRFATHHRSPYPFLAFYGQGLRRGRHIWRSSQRFEGG